MSIPAELASYRIPRAKRHSRAPIIKETINLVSLKTGLSAEDIASYKKSPELSYARVMVVYSIRNLNSNISYAQIGRYLGNRDHTTLAGMYKRAKSIMQFSEQAKNIMFILGEAA